MDYNGIATTGAALMGYNGITTTSAGVHFILIINPLLGPLTSLKMLVHWINKLFPAGNEAVQTASLSVSVLRQVDDFVCHWQQLFLQDSVTLELYGVKLEKKDFFGKSDPFLTISRSSEIDGS